MALGLGTMFEPLKNNVQPITGLGTSTTQASSPAMQWSSLDPTKIGNPQSLYGFYQANLQGLGWTGGNPLINNQTVSYDGGVNGNQEVWSDNWGIDPAFQKWMDSMGYSYGQSNVAGDKSGRGTMYSGILDKNGQLVGNPLGTSYDYNDSNLTKLASYIPAAVGLIGGANALGAFGGGGMGGADAAAAGAGGEGAFLGGEGSMGLTAQEIMAGAGGAAPPAGSLGAIGLGEAAGGLGAAGAANSVFNAAKDSQTANEQLGITTPSTNAPSSVNLGSLGGLGGILSNPGALGQIGQGLGTLFGGGKNGLAGGLAGLLGVLNANNQRNEWDQMKSQLDSMYSVDSPYAQMMRQKLERQDSMNGRNSQYGPREVELAAKLTEAKANSFRDMAMLKNNSFNAQNSGIKDLGSILGGAGASAGIGQILSGLGTGWDELMQLLGD